MDTFVGVVPGLQLRRQIHTAPRVLRAPRGSLQFQRIVRRSWKWCMARSPCNSLARRRLRVHHYQRITSSCQTPTPPVFNQSIVSLNYTIGILSYSKIEQNLKNFLFCYLFLSINKILILSFPCQNSNVSFSGLFRNSSRVSSYFIVIVVGVVCFIGEIRPFWQLQTP